MTPKSICSLLIGLVAVATSGCGWVRGEDEPLATSHALSPEQTAQARELAERDLGLDARSTNPRERPFFIKVDLLPDSEANTGRALVMVHHYRYQGDETILTMVDLNPHTVLKRETVVHFPTALAPSEFAHAEELARAEPKLQSLLA